MPEKKQVSCQTAMVTVFVCAALLGLGEIVLYGKAMAGLVLAATVIGGLATVILWWWLPSYFYALGRYIGGSLAGMKTWYCLIGPYVRKDDAKGRRYFALMWRWPPTPEWFMVPTTLDRPVRQLRLYHRGGIYGAFFSVAFLLLLGYAAHRVFDSDVVVWFALLPIIPLAVATYRLSWDLDRAGNQSDFALGYLAYVRLTYEQWAKIRPRDWNAEAVSAFSLQLIEQWLKFSLLEYAFTHWNDVPGSESRLGEVRAEMLKQVGAGMSIEDVPWNTRWILAYCATVFDRNLDSARSWLGDEVGPETEHAATWRSTAQLALYVVEGKREEAEALRQAMVADAEAQELGDYVRGVTDRIMQLKPAD